MLYYERERGEKKAKNLMLYCLNSDPEYYKKIKSNTQEKDNIKKKNGRWV